jgi:hypothetical protein
VKKRRERIVRKRELRERKKTKTHLLIVRPCPLNLCRQAREVGPHGDGVLVWDEPWREELGEGGGLCGGREHQHVSD